MAVKNPFRRNRARDENDAADVMPKPWWAWGPLGLIWYGEHNSGRDVDAGHLNPPGDVGQYNHNIDPGGGFSGFDGGAGGV